MLGDAEPHVRLRSLSQAANSGRRRLRSVGVVSPTSSDGAVRDGAILLTQGQVENSQQDESVEIGILHSQDAEQVVDLWRRSEARASVTDNVDDVTRIIDLETTECFVARAGKRIVGTVIAAYDGWRGNVYRLAVDPGYRRQGIGLKLLEHAQGAFDRWGVRRVSALVEQEHEWATAFWTAAGFVPDHQMMRFVRNVKG